MMNTLTLHHAWQAGVKKVVAAGAGCGYPEHAPLPLRETSFWDGFPPTGERSLLAGQTDATRPVDGLLDQHRFPVIVTVPGNIYGPYDNFDLENAHVIPALVRKFVTAVEQDQDRLEVWGSGARHP